MEQIGEEKEEEKKRKRRKKRRGKGERKRKREVKEELMLETKMCPLPNQAYHHEPSI